MSLRRVYKVCESEQLTHYEQGLGPKTALPSNEFRGARGLVIGWSTRTSYKNACSHKIDIFWLDNVFMLIHPPDVELVRIRVLDGNSCKGPTSQRPYRCTSAGKNGSIEFQIAWTHHQAITRTHANFSLLRVCGIHTRKVSERLFPNQHGSDIVKTYSWEKQKQFLSHIAMVCYWSVLHNACHIPGILHTVWWVLCSVLLVDLTICFSVLSIAIQ